MAWYRTGTISASAGSTTVTGNGTNFIDTASGVNAGDMLVVGGNFYEVANVTNATTLVLATAVTTNISAGTAYQIVTSTSMSNGALAKKVSAAMDRFLQSIANWTTLLTSDGDVSITPYGAANPISGPSWKKLTNKANSGENSDITKLKGLVAGGAASLEEAYLVNGEGEKGINLISDNTVGVSFGTEATNGGASVFHNFSKGPGGSGIKNGTLIGGYGSRPWDGSKYTAHSNACIHFIQAGDTTDSNHSAWLRLMITPPNSTISSRYAPFALSNNGDTMIGAHLPWNAYNGSGVSGNFSQYDGRGLKQFINNVNEVHLISGITSGSSSQANFRASLCGGSPLNPGPTQENSSAYLSLSGHDGSSWTQAQALIQMMAVEGWTTGSTACEIIFATTGTGTRDRYNRWVIQNDGIFAPAYDNNQSIGWSQRRVIALYAVNGTIQTSDGRLKTDVRPFTDDELSASIAISKEIGFWQWKEKVETEGEKARMHAGLTVQRAIEIMESFNLDPMAYGFICYDKWEESQEISGYDEDEKPLYRTVEAGDRYSFRVEQLNLFIARGMEERMTRLEEKLNA